jgi:hypothetical protein
MIKLGTVEGIDLEKFKAVSRHFSGGTEKNDKSLGTEHSQGQDLSPGSSKYEA